jgi:ATP-dependent Lhr-like helicase
VGRWALWGPDFDPIRQEERIEGIASQLLRRYGVVFRDVVTREKGAGSWRILLNIYRKWEAQGTLRGGRFVGGFVGEQFALPEAIEALRAVRKSGDDTEPVIISAADPLNLVGIILPGSRISPFSGLSIAYRNGAVTDIAPLGTLRTRLFAVSH